MFVGVSSMLSCVRTCGIIYYVSLLLPAVLVTVTDGLVFFSCKRYCYIVVSVCQCAVLFLYSQLTSRHYSVVVVAVER
jgi:hypothetical protein